MAKKNTASAIQLDFTNVKDGGGNFNKKRQPEGDYKGRITKVEDALSKGDGMSMWLFTVEVGTGAYPYYCKHVDNQLWKIRNIAQAAGIPVPKKRVKVDPNALVGKYIGVTLEDDEYEGKKQSVIQATFPTSELDSDAPLDADDQEGVEDDDGEPKKEKKGKHGKHKAKETEPAAEPEGKKEKGKKKKSKDNELQELDIEDI